MSILASLFPESLFGWNQVHLPECGVMLVNRAGGRFEEDVCSRGHGGSPQVQVQAPHQEIRAVDRNQGIYEHTTVVGAENGTGGRSVAHAGCCSRAPCSASSRCADAQCCMLPNSIHITLLQWSLMREIFIDIV